MENTKYINNEDVKSILSIGDFRITDCECPAREFRRYSPCKHMKRLSEKMSNLTIN